MDTAMSYLFFLTCLMSCGCCLMYGPVPPINKAVILNRASEATQETPKHASSGYKPAGDGKQDSQFTLKLEGKPGDQTTVPKTLTLSIKAPPESQSYNPKTRRASSGAEEFIDKIFSALTPGNRQEPILRAQEYGFKPQLVRFRSEDQPAVKFEINSDNVMRVINKVLESPDSRRYIDLAVKTAAGVYHKLKKYIDLKEDNHRRN